MNGQLYVSYCSSYGEDTNNCPHKQEHQCAYCPYNRWVQRLPQKPKEQPDNSTGA